VSPSMVSLISPTQQPAATRSTVVYKITLTIHNSHLSLQPTNSVDWRTPFHTPLRGANFNSNDYNIFTLHFYCLYYYMPIDLTSHAIV
jgi:hypothetical protein